MVTVRRLLHAVGRYVIILLPLLQVHKNTGRLIHTPRRRRRRDEPIEFRADGFYDFTRYRPRGSGYVRARASIFHYDLRFMIVIIVKLTCHARNYNNYSHTACRRPLCSRRRMLWTTYRNDAGDSVCVGRFREYEFRRLPRWLRDENAVRVAYVFFT